VRPLALEKAAASSPHAREGELWAGAMVGNSATVVRDGECRCLFFLRNREGMKVEEKRQVGPVRMPDKERPNGRMPSPER
jgi:hypothetical protein